MKRYMNLTQFRLIEESAEDILDQFQKQLGVGEIYPPIPVDVIAESLLGHKCVLANLTNLVGGSDGALIREDKIILIEEMDPIVRRRFTISHEIGHIVLPDAEKPTDELYYNHNAFKHPDRRMQLVEKACDMFAGALLIPRQILNRELKKFDIVNDETINQLAVTFDVSVSAMLYRIKYLSEHLEGLSVAVDQDSFDALETNLSNARHARVKTNTQIEKRITNPFEYIFDSSDHQETVHIVYKWLLRKGILKVEYRNGKKVLRDVKSPREILGKPLVIEFSGTPNAGKDTQIEIIADYLRDYRGYKVLVFDEPYYLCTLRNRTDFKIYWMIAVTIKNLVEIADMENVDVVIFNRGLFDNLAFLDYYQRRGNITKREMAVYSSSLTVNRLTDLVDIVFLMKTTPDKSVQREMEFPREAVSRLAEELDQSNVNPTPTLTKDDGLQLLNDCYENVLAKYKDAFEFIHTMQDDGDVTIDDVAIEIGRQIITLLPKLDRPLNEEDSALHLHPEVERQLSFFSSLRSRHKD